MVCETHAQQCEIFGSESTVWANKVDKNGKYLLWALNKTLGTNLVSRIKRV